MFDIKTSKEEFRKNCVYTLQEFIFILWTLDVEKISKNIFHSIFVCKHFFLLFSILTKFYMSIRLPTYKILDLCTVVHKCSYVPCTKLLPTRTIFQKLIFYLRQFCPHFHIFPHQSYLPFLYVSYVKKVYQRQIPTFDASLMPAAIPIHSIL